VVPGNRSSTNQAALRCAGRVRPHRPVQRRFERGVSLIEVLVAIVIFSLGLLGLALMQLKGSTFTKEAGARTMSTLQVSSLIDAMQANPAGAEAGDYVFSGSTAPAVTDCSSTTCTPKQVACNDIAAWIAQTEQAAPQARGGEAAYVIASNATVGGYIAKVYWNGVIAPEGSSGPPSPSDLSEAMLYMPPAAPSTAATPCTP
jgi:type IV pilus assembly protein PilV